MQTANGDAILDANTNPQRFHEDKVLGTVIITTWRTIQHCTLQCTLYQFALILEGFQHKPFQRRASEVCFKSHTEMQHKASKDLYKLYYHTICTILHQPWISA